MRGPRPGSPLALRHRKPHRGWQSLALALLLAAAQVASAQGLTPEHVVRLETVGAVAMSPDGRWVAYTVGHPRGEDEEPGRGRAGLWLVPTAGGEPRVVVQRPATGSAPAWSPDGRTLTFITRIEGQHAMAQVYGVDPQAPGEPRRLTDSPTGVSSYLWSTDGRSIAYLAVEPEDPERAEQRRRGFDHQVFGADQRHVRLWVKPLEGERRAISPAGLTVREYAWSPDGSTFAVQTVESTDADADLMFRRLQVVPAAGGELRTFATTEGKLGPMAWSPDGQHLAWLGATSMRDPLAQSVFVAPRAGGQGVNLIPGYEGSAVWLGWQDRNTVMFIAAEGTRTALNRVARTGGQVARIIGRGAEVFQTASFDARNATFAAPVNSASHPNEVYVATLGRQAQFRRVTRLNPWLAQVQLARQETVAWDDGRGLRIEGVLTYPAGYAQGTRYPLLILPHGGPEGISFDGWTTRALYPAQVLANRGYMVLEPNYRASGGRGVEFSMADHRDLGGREFDDVLAGIDHLAERGLVDPERVGISGTSYGGYFSAWAATRHTERFRAAATFAGIANWISFTGQTDIPHEMSLVHWDKYWWDSPGLAWDRSPMAWVNQAQTPTLVGHGLVDERVHPAQSLEMYQTLKLKGVPTELVFYPREPHGLLERAHQLDFMRRLSAWMDRYVKGEEALTP